MSDQRIEDFHHRAVSPAALEATNAKTRGSSVNRGFAAAAASSSAAGEKQPPLFSSDRRTLSDMRSRHPPALELPHPCRRLRPRERHWPWCEKPVIDRRRTRSQPRHLYPDNGSPPAPNVPNAIKTGRNRTFCDFETDAK